MIYSITTEPIQVSATTTSGYLQISNGSSDILSILEAYTYQKAPSAITGGIRVFELSRVSASGTGEDITTSCVPWDTTNDALPAGLRIDQKVATLTLSGGPLGGCSVYSEEGANLYLTKGYITKFRNLGLSKPIIVRPGETVALHLAVGTLNSAGWLVFNIVFDI